MCDMCCAAPVSLYVVTTAPQSTPADPAVAQTDNVTNFQEHRGAEIYFRGAPQFLDSHCKRQKGGVYVQKDGKYYIRPNEEGDYHWRGIQGPIVGRRGLLTFPVE